jgi:hypothetical protein
MGAYFETLKMLMWAFMFIFIVTTPIMYIYSTGQGISQDYMGVVTKYSLGNLGMYLFFKRNSYSIIYEKVINLNIIHRWSPRTLQAIPSKHCPVLIEVQHWSG